MGDAGFCVVLLLVLAPAVWAMLFQVEAWPLSAYPMFAVYRRAEIVRVYRLRLKSRGGAEFWWAPRHERKKRDFHMAFRRLGDPDRLSKGVLRDILRKLFHDISREPGFEELASLVLVERVLRIAPDGGVAVTEERLFGASFAALEKEFAPRTAA